MGDAAPAVLPAVLPAALPGAAPAALPGALPGASCSTHPSAGTSVSDRTFAPSPGRTGR